jgi:hypothetical protein
MRITADWDPIPLIGREDMNSSMLLFFEERDREDMKC